jgi:uncharacterized membrane protein YhdT
LSKDQAYGGVVLIISVAIALFYLAALFPTHFGLPAWLAWWAIALPVILAVLAVLVICMWIGWVMLSTPPVEEFHADTAQICGQTQLSEYPDSR